MKKLLKLIGITIALTTIGVVIKVMNISKTGVLILPDKTIIKDKKIFIRQ